jgi:hypothetical protein
MSIWTILAAIGAPSAIAAAVIGVMVRRFEKKMDEAEKARAKHEADRRAFELFEVQTLFATASLCEANAIALQNGKCNGETHAALEYLQKVKHKQKDFLIEKGVDQLF